MSFDYATVNEVFAYGNSAGTNTDPVDESAVMAGLITAVSRAIDEHCGQVFGLTTRVLARLTGYVNRDGWLLLYPPTPTLTTMTTLQTLNGRTWADLSTVNMDTIDAPHGVTVRVPCDLPRFTAISARMSYTGGYANLAALPADLRLAARQLCWYAYKRREGVNETTALPELGMVTVPGTWPADILRMLAPYVRVVPS